MGECLIIRSGGGTDTSGATATAEVILSGYTAYVNDEKITGTMPVQTLNQTLNPGGSVTLPAGYYEEGANVISASALSGATAGTAAASHILSGYTAWVNGSKLTGTMTNRGAISQKLSANGSYTVPAGWHNGSGKVTQSLTTQGGKTVTPTTSNQTACAANRWTTGNIVVAGNANLKAANIKNGITIFGIRGTFTGWVDNTMNCTDLAHFSISHDNPLNQEVRISKSGYRAFATLNGMDNVEEDVNYIRENVIPYFSYIKVTASAQFRQAVRAIGDISLRAWHNYYPSKLFQQSRATIDTVTIASVVDPSTTFNLSGNTYIKIKQGSYATYPYICFLRVVIDNSAKGDIYATMKSVKIEFAKTNS